MIKYYNKFQKPIQSNIFYVEKELDGVGVEIALQYVDDIVDRIVPFANNIHTPEGGTHMTGDNCFERSVQQRAGGKA